MHDLNTNYALYTALKASLPAADARKPVPNIGTGAWESGRRVEGRSGSNGAFDEESLLVGRMLLRDFERYGVHLNGSTRDRMSDLVARTQALGFTFVQNTIDPGKCGEVVLQGTAARSLQTLPPQLQRAFRPRQASGTATRMHGGVSALAARGTGPVLNSLLWHADNETVRKAAYRVYNTHPVDNVAVLDQLVTARHEMAALMGFPSYAHYQLDQFSLAGVPGAVQEFLNTLGTAIWPSCEAEAQALTAVKQRYSTRDADASARGQLKPWDWHWAVGRANAEDSTGTHVSALGQYLTLDGCVAALSTLLEGLMGVRLREERPASGEVWAPEVRRLVAEHAEEGPLGVVYLDLYRREGKFPGAAHFTLRCGRRLDDGAYQVSSNYSPLCFCRV